MSEKYKTKRCRQFYSKGWCPYGQRCQFLHDEAKDLKYRTAETSPDIKPSQDYLKILEAVEDFWNLEEELPHPKEEKPVFRARLQAFEKITVLSQPDMVLEFNVSETDQPDDDRPDDPHEKGDDDKKEFLAFKETEKDNQTGRTRFYSFYT